ncbi:hypothetical protein H5410_027105, partial [Solanum commersonii]
GIKEKHLTMLDQAIMESILLCKSKILKEGYYCSIQGIMKWCGLTKVKLLCKHPLIQDKATLKGTISQSKAIHEFY